MNNTRRYKFICIYRGRYADLYSVNMACGQSCNATSTLLLSHTRSRHAWVKEQYFQNGVNPTDTI